MVIINNARIDLHVHPMRNQVEDIVAAMLTTDTNVVGLEALDRSIYQQLSSEITYLYPWAVKDTAGVVLDDLVFFNAREYNTREGLHVLTVGYSFDKAAKDTEIREVIDMGLKNNAFVLLDHPFIDNGKSRTAGHISAEKEALVETLCREYSGNIAVEWNAYCIPWMRAVLKTGLNAAHALGISDIDISYHDVNKKSVDLSSRNLRAGINTPLVADTDLHARNSSTLRYIGRSSISCDIEGECGADMLACIKKKVFDHDYKNSMRYVPSYHLIPNFCIPIVMEKVFNSPRAE